MTHALHSVPDNASLIIRLALNMLWQHDSIALADRHATGSTQALSTKPNGHRPLNRGHAPEPFIIGRYDRNWLNRNVTPRLVRLCQRYETLLAVTHAQSAQGLAQTSFTAPRRPNPPEGPAK